MGSKGAVSRRNSDGQQRNPDFSRQNKQGPGFSRNRSRPNHDRDEPEKLEETDFLSSKNGPLFSTSSSPRFQATAAPGPREKEIVELFRKVQAQLRERAAVKEEKKNEAAKGQVDRGSVDSLLKLLRKHSFEQGTRQSSDDVNLQQPERTGPLEREPKSSYFGSNSKSLEQSQGPKSTNFSRPPSDFRRKSPVPRVKYQPVYSANPSGTEDSTPKRQGRRKKKIMEPEAEDDLLPTSNEELDDISGSLSSESYELDDEIHEPDDGEISAPIMDYQPVYSADLMIPENSSPKRRGRQKMNVREAETVHDFSPTSSKELESVSGSLSSEPEEPEESEGDISETDDMLSAKSISEPADLSSMKLPDLKALAKSRGVKGVSKLKKAELLKLLHGELG
ncbi:SAP-like protein [Nymphaea thermarum]|nr:SAP-like protein [Nymphaea thermarum]